MLPWAKATKVVNGDNGEKYDFDVTKADRICDMLLEKGHIKLTPNRKMPSAEELKKRRYCKYHGTSTHHTNECRVFRDCIQRAIEKRRIGLDKNSKKTMGMEDHPFPQNMVAVLMPKGKIRVLTSNKAKETVTVDPGLQMTAEEYQEVKARCDRQKSRLERAETSKAGDVCRRPTSWILLNKWQHQ